MHNQLYSRTTCTHVLGSYWSDFFCNFIEWLVELIEADHLPRNRREWFRHSRRATRRDNFVGNNYLIGIEGLDCRLETKEGGLDC